MGNTDISVNTLPDANTENTTEHSTIFDDVFRTIAQKMPQLLIPLINEVFHTSYSEEEPFEQLRNEHYEKFGTVVTDSIIRIGSHIYHLECQSTKDETMVIRMFEYDTQLALENKELTADTLTVRFPDSAVVSLRHTQNTPEEMTVKVQTPGGKVSYKVPVLKIKRYTVNELFEKKLFFLIPFHIFVYEKNFKELEENKKKLKQLEEEYAAIRERLEIACQMGDLTEYPKVVILAMSRKVIEHLAAKYEKVAKGVSQQMGGKVLNYEAKDILNRGRAEGRREGEEQTKIQIAKKLLALGNDIQSVADLAELPEETVEKLARSTNQSKR